MSCGISTCVESLTHPGRCCTPHCDQPAVVAILHRIDKDVPGVLMECIRCLDHVDGVVLASKPVPPISTEWKAGQ